MKMRLSIIKAKGINKSLVIGLTMACMGVTSCDYLDFDQSTGFDSQSEVYEVFSRTEQSLTNVYSYLDSDFGSIGGAMRDCATDDAVYEWSNSDINIFVNGSWSPTKVVDTKWSSLYTGIRAANQFIKNMEETDYTKYKWNADYPAWNEKAQYWIPQARFLRSLYLFELARRYGDIPLATGIYTVDNINSLKKSSFNDVINYIVEECDSVAKKLPADYNAVSGKQTGRVTKGAALALKSRALLYAASPLFSEYSQQKWIKAAKAAKEVMDLNLYSLVDEESVNNLESKELILERRMGASCDFEKRNFPISFDKGNTGTCPSQNLVDAFQTVNGYDVTLTEEGWKCDDPKFDANHPYVNRDKRFYKSVLYDGCVFKNKTLACYEGGAEGLPVIGASKTGYYLRKYVMDKVDLAPVEKTMYHYWVLFRYAEIILNYAEAMNQAYGPDAAADGMQSAVEVINNSNLRQRAGMPAVKSGMSKEDFQKFIEHERRVEFAFENQRFWDVRRWKIGGDTQNGIFGVKIIKAEDNTKTYTKVAVETRQWNDKMNLYPIPMSELTRNSNLYPQNQGW